MTLEVAPGLRVGPVGCIPSTSAGLQPKWIHGRSHGRWTPSSIPRTRSKGDTFCSAPWMGSPWPRLRGYFTPWPAQQLGGEGTDVCGTGWAAPVVSWAIRAELVGEMPQFAAGLLLSKVHCQSKKPQRKWQMTPYLRDYETEVNFF